MEEPAAHPSFTPNLERHQRLLSHHKMELFLELQGFNTSLLQRGVEQKRKNTFSGKSEYFFFTPKESFHQVVNTKLILIHRFCESMTREYSEVLEVKCYFIWGSGKVAPLTGLPAASFSASLFLFFIPVSPHPPFLSPSPSPSLRPSLRVTLPALLQWRGRCQAEGEAVLSAAHRQCYGHQRHVAITPPNSCY